MNRKYINQADVDKVQKMIEGISPDLKISWYSLNREENAVTVVGLSLPMKGNGKLIEKLVAAGFKKCQRYKIESGRTWNMYEGYTFGLRLTYRLPELPKEECMC